MKGEIDKNLELIENYPGFSSGIAEAKLAIKIKNQDDGYNLELEYGKVTALEIYSEFKCRCYIARVYSSKEGEEQSNTKALN